MSSFIDDLRDIPGLNDLTRKARDTGLRVTGEDADGDYDDSADELDVPQRETFPCESCQGTGLYKGVRVHQAAVECFACKGKGYFFKSYKDRLDARNKRAARKQAKIASGLDALNAAHPGLIDGMRRHSWNDFLARMLAELEGGRTLSEKAIDAALASIAKADARDAQRAAEKAARIEGAPTLNADQLKASFDKAVAAGLKRPVLRFDGFQVSRAPDHGKNAGALYVKATDTDTYLGKIVGGKYLPTREAEAAGLVARVVEAMTDPFAVAIAYGKRTGNCSCCGRKLTDPVSVHNGVGPICAERYGWNIEIPAELPPTKLQVQGSVAASAPRTTKYEYAPGMSDADKRKLRAAARKARN